MKFGMSLPASGPLSQPEEITTIAQRAEKLGFHYLGMSDHIVIPSRVESHYPYSATGKFGLRSEWLEQLSVLSYMAAKTTKISLMTSIMVLPHRNPLLAAKMLSTIDVMSKGRLIVGVGTGWMKEEFEALNLPPFEERGWVSDEYIRIFKELWTAEEPEFQGRYFSFSGIQVLPKPLQKPHPPVWVGGESPRAIRRAAELGDAWYPGLSNPQYPFGTIQKLQSRIETLRAQTRAVGRNAEVISIGLGGMKYAPAAAAPTEGRLFAGNVEKIIEDIRRCEDIGVDALGVSLMAGSLEETLAAMDTFSKEIISKIGS